jgi:DNA-binding IclR family transcriptional regulator
MTTAFDRPPEEAAEDTSLARGLRIFLTIADRGEIRADELSTLLETPLSTVYRYLRTLTEFGFIERQEGGYKLGSRLHVLGAGRTVTAEELIRASDPVLAALAESTGETSFISRRIGLGVMTLAEHPSGQPLRVVPELGQADPLTVGAVALVLLAYAPDEVQDAALADVGAGDAAAIGRQLSAIVSDAYAQDDGETFSGATTMAVPVLSDDGIVAAIGLTAPTERTNRRWQARARGGLRRAARAIEEELQTGDRSG